jgi:hypothetical protein
MIDDKYFAAVLREGRLNKRAVVTLCIWKVTLLHRLLSVVSCKLLVTTFKLIACRDFLLQGRITK